MSTRNIVPRANEEGNIGSSLKHWLKGWFKNLFVSGNITDGNTGTSLTVMQLQDAIDDKHNSYLLGTKTLDEANIADLKILQYKSSSGKIEYITLPGGGDMLKSVYDTGDNGIVDNSEKLESSTKAQVQDHSPKTHTHVEVDITDLDHYDSADFTTDFASENLANLGTKSYNDLTNKPDLSDLHNHINKLLLDTYDQTNVDISDAVTHKDLTTNPHTVTVDQLDLASGTIASDIDDAVTKKHNHSNKTLLDTYTQTEVDIADVISKEHIHSNKTQLDLVTDGDHDVISSGNPHSVTKSDVGLGNVDNLQQIPLTQKGSANGVAELGIDSKIPTSQLPALAITDVYTAGSEIVQLALTVQKGDVCVRTDENKSYIALNSDNVDMADWQELLTPTDTVLSVNGETGAVTLDSDDIAEGVSNLYLTGNEFQKTTDDLDDITDGSTYKKSHNDFTDVLKSKLDGIAPLAEVNVNADWNAGSGDAQILNKPDLSDLHSHTNKTLLDTYTQTEANLASAVSLKHSNSLDHTQGTDTDLDATFEATFVKKVDNVNVLADITSPGANIEDAVIKKHSHVNQPSCKAYQSSAQSISSASYTSVVLDAEDFDVGSMHDNVTNNTRITIQAGQAGTYLIIGQISFASNSTGYRRCQIRLNGTTTIANDRNSAISGTATTVDVSTIEQLSVGDYVEMRAYQNSGGSRNLLTGKEDTFFSVHKLS